MGDIADMMLEGILDANGEYTGRNPGHPVYPKGWFGKVGKGNSHPSVTRVTNFMLQRGIAKGDEQKKTLLDYGKEVDSDRPTYHACSNWPTFKSFIDKRVGYIKPSKIK